MANGRVFSRGSNLARARRPKNKTFWELGPGGDDIATWDSSGFTGDTTVILGLGATPVGQPLTVMRLHGVLEILLSTATSALDGFNWAFGVGVCTADAFAIGVTAVPNPFDDISWNGWMVHKMGAIHSPIAGVATAFPSNAQSLEIESKAMRKLNLNEVLFAAIQVGEVGVSVMTVRFASRILLQVTGG